MPSKPRLLMVWLFAACLLSAQTPAASRAKQKAAPQPSAPAKSDGEQLYNLRGRVIDSGRNLPVSGAVITFTSEPLYQRGDPRNPASMLISEVITDVKGEFAVPVPARDYTYEVRAGSYVIDEKARRLFTISKGKTPEPLTIRMLRVAAISGVVEDAEGNGLEGVRVEVASAMILPLRNQTTTASSGKFTIPSVAPGSYAIRAYMGQQAEGESTRFVTTYYPGTTDSFSADEVTLNGVDLTNIRIRMQKAELRSVSGNVTGSERNPYAAKFVVLRPIEDPRVGVSLYGRLQLRSEIDEGGTFSIGEVPPGRYTATVEGGDSKRTGLPLATELVAVGDRDIEDLRMSVAPGGMFAGKIIVENGSLPKDWEYTSLRGQGAAGSIGTPMTIKRDGSFSIEGLSNGNYAFVAPALTGYSVSSVEMGGQKYEGSRFAFAVPGSADVVIRLSAGGAIIQGGLTGTRGPDNPVTGTATAVLMAGLMDGVPYLRKTTLAANGSFTFIDLEPGQYLACAWSDYSQSVDKLLTSGTPPVAKLQQLCKTIDVKAGAFESVELGLTSLAEITR